MRMCEKKNKTGRKWLRLQAESAWLLELWVASHQEGVKKKAFLISAHAYSFIGLQKDRLGQDKTRHTYVSRIPCVHVVRDCVCDWAAVLKAAFQLIICSAVDPAAEFSRVCGGCAIAAPVLTAQSTTTYIRTENYVISYMKLPVFQPSDPPTFFFSSSRP